MLEKASIGSELAVLQSIYQSVMVKQGLSWSASARDLSGMHYQMENPKAESEPYGEIISHHWIGNVWGGRNLG